MKKRLNENPEAGIKSEKTSISEEVLNVKVVIDHEKIEQGLRDWLRHIGYFYQREIGDNHTVVVYKRGNTIGKTDPDDVVGFFNQSLDDLSYSEYAELKDLMYLNQQQKIQTSDYHLASLTHTHEKQILREKMFELLPIHDAPVLKNTVDTKYYPYANCVVEVTENGVKFIKYEDLGGCFVWEHNIIKKSLPLSDDYKNVIHF